MKLIPLLLIVCLFIPGCGGGGGSNDPQPTYVEIQANLPGISTVRVTNLNPTGNLTFEMRVNPETGYGIVSLDIYGKVKFEVMNFLNQVQTTKTVNIPKPSGGLYTQVDLSLENNELEIKIKENVPDLSITKYPELFDYGYVEGKIYGGNPKELCTATYIRVKDSWWMKPYQDTPAIDVQDNGTWQCDITTGGNDPSATEILTFLIYRSDIDQLPEVLGGSKPELPFALDYDHIWR